MEKIRISELPKAITVNDGDSIVILQGSTTKTVSVDKITSKIPGVPGANGKQIELRKGSTHIE